MPLSGTPTRTCDRPPAMFKVTKTAGTGAGPIGGVRSIQPGDESTLIPSSRQKGISAPEKADGEEPGMDNSVPGSRNPAYDRGIIHRTRMIVGQRREAMTRRPEIRERRRYLL